MLREEVHHGTTTQIFPIELFHWEAKDRTFVAEMSMLAHHNKVSDHFKIYNHKTGRSCEFQFNYIDRNEQENETLSWNYISLDNEPSKRGIKLIIFND